MEIPKNTRLALSTGCRLAHLLRGALVALACVAALAPSTAAIAQASADEATAPAPPPAPPPNEATPQDGPTLPIGEITLRYLRENPLHPPLEAAMDVTVELAPTDTGYIAPRPGDDTVVRTIGEYSEREPEAFHASAIQRMLEALRDHFLGLDLLGVYVAPDPAQISSRSEDLRPRGDTGLTIIVTTGIITELRTLGRGPRVSDRGPIKPQNAINNDAHARIRRNSPVRPFVPADPTAPVDPTDPEAAEAAAEQSDLLKKDELDRYVFFLGRHPGRRVDAALSAAEDPGTLALDFQVTENRPLVLYFQAANTGTPSTDYWRQRFGLLHTQLTNNDDILSLDYITASFDRVNAFTGYYEAPVGQNDRLRWRVQGNWFEYDAREVGFFSDVFKGETFGVQGEIAWNFWQNRDAFLDLLGGLRYNNHEVDNQAFGVRGEQDFLVPYVGIRYDRRAEWFRSLATVLFEWQVGDITDVDRTELSRLGRLAPDRDWQVLRWAASHNVYLEPVLNRDAWEDPTTPESSKLVHELQLLFRGQWAFDNRLIPQEQSVVGGLYSVRGYPQSVIAGDTTVIGSIEYRFHLPRAFDIQEEPGELFGETFRYAPQFVYGTPDWDLLLKAFFDAAAVWQSDKFSFESDETLFGAGIGLEFLYKRNLNIRVDWGFVLRELENRDVNEGSNRVHFVATILF